MGQIVNKTTFYHHIVLPPSVPSWILSKHALLFTDFSSVHWIGMEFICLLSFSNVFTLAIPPPRNVSSYVIEEQGLCITLIAKCFYIDIGQSMTSCYRYRAENDQLLFIPVPGTFITCVRDYSTLNIHVLWYIIVLVLMEQRIFRNRKNSIVN